MKFDEEELKQSLETALERYQIPGASIAVFHDGELITAATGVTNVTTGVALTEDTVMHIGSITKVFTATLVMQLVDEGAVELDAPVQQYLPDLKLKDSDALKRMTVTMLLNHTSGIDGITLPDLGHDEETLEKRVARYAEMGQLFGPGEEFSYCNPGVVIAGYLAQRLTGESWYRLVKERIFNPLEMKHAATLPEEALLFRTSVGHYSNRVTKKLERTSRAFNPLGGAPGGATLMMSARDLISFARAHMGLGSSANGTRLLSERSARAMQRMTVNNENKGYACGVNMGLGWMISGDGLLHHGGTGPGFISYLYAHPERNRAIAILTNGNHGIELINAFATPWLEELGTKLKPYGTADIRMPALPAGIDHRKYVGTYEDIMSRKLVSWSPDGLMLMSQWKSSVYDNMSTQALPPVRLIPLGGEEFLLETQVKDDVVTAGEAQRMVTFRNPDHQGRMRNLGNGGVLFVRSA